MRSSKPRQKNCDPRLNAWKRLALGIGLAVLVLLLAYLAWNYRSLEGESQGIVACSPEGECTLSGHWHARIHAEACGTKIVFPLETGNLAEQHTHKERDLMHWHATLPLNPGTKKVADWTPLQLGNFFTNMKVAFTSSCLGTFCNGTPCPDGKEHTLVMTVNGKPNKEFDSYVWKDGDEILIKTIRQ